ncbi:MAG: formylmethanofuran dehydrogenase subunit C [Hyphomicrobiales bacterium]
MSALTFELKAKPDQRLDLSPLTPERLAKLSRKDIEALSIGTTRAKRTVGDTFKIKGKDVENIHFVGTDARCDKIGAGLAGGEITVEGHAGAELGARMKKGKITVKGSCGVLAGASMSGGHIAIGRDAGDQACGVATGDTMGMKGGFVTIGGHAGALLGERMRRGLVVVGGHAGDYAGGRMIAGILVLKRGAGRYAGYGNRRGSLIFMDKPKNILPTYSDCGVMEFDYLRLLELWLREQGTRITLKGRARRLMGDMAVLGKGEMLILA